MSNIIPINRNVFAFLIIILIIVNENASEENSTMNHKKIEELKKLIATKCSANYSSNCFLLDLCKVIDKLGSTNNYQLLPGLFVVRSNENAESRETPMDIFEDAVTNNKSDNLDVYFHKKLNLFLDSISLTLKIMDRNSIFSVRKLSDDLINELLPISTAVPRSINKMLKKIKIFIQKRLPKFILQPGRGKKKGYKDAAIWAAGALATLGSSALFALTGKAAITSLVALALSMMCYFKGHGGSSHYTTSGAIVTPYRHECSEAIIDVNGRGEHATAIVGYKKRTAEDNWNFPRYASTSEPFHGTEPPPIYHGPDSYSKMLRLK